jgi:uncharacterized tellurite resistance protein B-like protein
MTALPQLKLLINLAGMDGEVGEKERNYIFNIGRANGLAEVVVEPLFNTHHETIIPTNLDSDQKFNYIVSLVQLMKIDGRLYKEEIKYCSRVAAKLGYTKEIIFDLMLHVSATMAETEVKALRELTKKYLTK